MWRIPWLNIKSLAQKIIPPKINIDKTVWIETCQVKQDIWNRWFKAYTRTRKRKPEIVPGAFLSGFYPKTPSQWGLVGSCFFHLIKVEMVRKSLMWVISIQWELKTWQPAALCSHLQINQNKDIRSFLYWTDIKKKKLTWNFQWHWLLSSQEREIIVIWIGKA